MKYTYKTHGTCSREITFEVNDGIVTNVSFYGGCNGNLQGIRSLVKGMKLDEVKEKLNGIKCGFRDTSCPDQIASAIKEYQGELVK